MKRADFMAQLRAGLSGLHAADINDALADYESHFADGAAAGRSEEEVCAALGDPVRLAREMRAEMGFRRWEENRSAGNLFGVILALLGLATIDLIFLFPALIILLGLFIGFTACCITLVAGGAFMLVNMLPGFHHVVTNAMVQFFAGLGALSGGIGLGALTFLVTNWVARGLIRYARLHFRLFDTATQSI
jgi:uncharacterized membrane protein